MVLNPKPSCTHLWVGDCPFWSVPGLGDTCQVGCSSPVKSQIREALLLTDLAFTNSWIHGLLRVCCPGTGHDLRNMPLVLNIRDVFIWNGPLSGSHLRLLHENVLFPEIPLPILTLLPGTPIHSSNYTLFCEGFDLFLEEAFMRRKDVKWLGRGREWRKKCTSSVPFVLMSSYCSHNKRV